VMNLRSTQSVNLNHRPAHHYDRRMLREDAAAIL
jgi:hypothetical protein